MRELLKAAWRRVGNLLANKGLLQCLQLLPQSLCLVGTMVAPTVVGGREARLGVKYVRLRGETTACGRWQDNVGSAKLSAQGHESNHCCTRALPRSPPRCRS